MTHIGTPAGISDAFAQCLCVDATHECDSRTVRLSRKECAAAVAIGECAAARTRYGRTFLGGR
ncbi:hypothetical protein GCM10009834_29790 [Streptomonospora arabica]